MFPKTCPDRDALLDYLVGKLPEESTDALACHLESCPTCQAELATLSDHEDTLIAQLRGSPASDPYLDEPECEAAMARARAVAAGADAIGPLSQEASEVSFPRQLGEYCLIERLGVGGMGTVYKVLHSKLDRVVALKVLPRARIDDPRAVVRFEREMKAIGRLDHPHIVRAYDAREIEGRLVLAMEFVEGLDLARIVRRLGGLSVADACELARQAALGLQAAHEHGLIHRDVKPSNLMLTPQGQVKLLDLGLARFASGGLSQFSSPANGVAAGGPDSSAIGAAQPQAAPGNCLLCFRHPDSRAIGATRGGLSQFSSDENGTVPFRGGRRHDQHRPGDGHRRLHGPRAGLRQPARSISAPTSTASGLRSTNSSPAKPRSVGRSITARSRR